MTRYDNKMAQLRSYCLFGETVPSVSAEDLARIEDEIGASLPNGYAEFLSAYGGYAPGGYAFFRYLETYPRGDKGILDIFFGFRPGDAYDLSGNYRQYKGRVPRELLPIGSDPGGNIICLSLGGRRKGAIYFWDHEQEEMALEGSEPGFSNVYLISHSFDDFVNDLEFEEA